MKRMNTNTPAALATLVIATAAWTAQANEVIGDSTLMAPDSASHVAGDFNELKWLNVDNEFASVTDAFTGSGLLDSGFANSDFGLTFEVLFNDGVTNTAGTDMVLFDARFDAGPYQISTDWDGFSSTLMLDASSFTDTGESRDYFFGINTNGPFNAQLWARDFDLSWFGVPEGETVHSVRFMIAGSGADPIALAAIVPLPGTLLLSVAGIGMIAVSRKR